MISSSFSDFSKGKSTVFNDDGSVKDFKPLDFQARLDAMLKPNQTEPKKHLNVHSDGPMGVGIISQDALKDYRPSISTYVRTVAIRCKNVRQLNDDTMADNLC